MSHSTQIASIAETLTRASAVTDQIFCNCVGATFGLRRVEFGLLQAISGNQRINQKGLTKAVGASAPAVSLALDRMEKRGLVERTHSSSDGRCRCIQLTESGGELVRIANENLRRGEALALASLSPSERDFLCELLLRIAKTSSELVGMPSDRRDDPDVSALDVSPPGASRAKRTLRLCPTVPH